MSQKVHYCGYVTERHPALKSVKEVRAELGFQEPFVVVTVGGGGDGFPLIQNCLQALQLIPETPAFIVTGPLMSLADRTELQSLAARRPGIVLRDYVRDLPSYMAAANLVISMAGYNTCTEILKSGKPSILLPRTAFRHEQRIRAMRFEELGLAENALGASPLQLRLAVERALEGRAQPRITPPLDGAARMVDVVQELCGAGASPSEDEDSRTLVG